jgi:hypothetical protein
VGLGGVAQSAGTCPIPACYVTLRKSQPLSWLCFCRVKALSLVFCVPFLMLPFIYLFTYSCIYFPSSTGV